MQPTVSPSASWCRYCEAAPPGYLVRARVGGWGLGLRSGSGSGLGSGLWLPLPLPLTGVPLHQQVKGAEPRLLGDGRVRAHGVVGRTRHAQQQARARGQVERLAWRAARKGGWLRRLRRLRAGSWAGVWVWVGVWAGAWAACGYARVGRRVVAFRQPEGVERRVVVVLSLGDEGKVEPRGGEVAARGVLQRARAPLPDASKRARSTEEAQGAARQQRHPRCKRKTCRGHKPPDR